MAISGAVLIIDDEAEVRIGLLESLKVMDLFRNIVEAKDGVEAHRKLSNQEFSLIILDNKMPKTSGLDVIKGIKSEKSHQNYKTPIIFFSGQFDKKDVMVARDFKIRYFLTKPIDNKKLELMVRHALGIQEGDKKTA